MKRANGYAVSCVDGVVVEETDTFSCGHCNGIVPIRPFQNDADACLACDTHICPACAAALARSLRCVSLEKRLDMIEKN